MDKYFRLRSSKFVSLEVISEEEFFPSQNIKSLKNCSIDSFEISALNSQISTINKKIQALSKKNEALAKKSSPQKSCHRKLRKSEDFSVVPSSNSKRKSLKPVVENSLDFASILRNSLAADIKVGPASYEFQNNLEKPLRPTGQPGKKKKQSSVPAFSSKIRPSQLTLNALKSCNEQENLNSPAVSIFHHFFYSQSHLTESPQVSPLQPLEGRSISPRILSKKSNVKNSPPISKDQRKSELQRLIHSEKAAMASLSSKLVKLEARIKLFSDFIEVDWPKLCSSLHRFSEVKTFLQEDTSLSESSAPVGTICPPPSEPKTDDAFECSNQPIFEYNNQSFLQADQRPVQRFFSAGGYSERESEAELPNQQFK